MKIIRIELIEIKEDFINYPNPFNPITTISLNLPSDSDLSLEIYNIEGQKIKKTLVKQKIVAEINSVKWNGNYKESSKVSSGIYLYKVKFGNEESVKRMMLLK